jgi:hypothetical protein
MEKQSDEYPNKEDPRQKKAHEEDDEVEERLRWFQGTRVNPDDRKLSENQFIEASRQRHRIEQEERDKRRSGFEAPPTPPGMPGTVNWTPIGPSVVAHGQASLNPPVSGRVTSIAVGPSGTRVYIGAANGGVWFSDNGGGHWTPLDDYDTSPTFTSGAEADSLSVGALGVRFGTSAATDLLYVGTGEANSSLDSYFGIGIRTSAAGGAPGTWTLEATNLANRSIYRIVIDPDNPSIVHAATNVGIFRRPGSSPFTTWTQVTSSTFTNANLPANDIIIAGSGSSKMYYAVFQGDRVYSSPDASAWTALSGIPGTSGRVVLAAGESDPTAVYAFAQSGGLFRLVGTAFQSVSGVPTVFQGGQGWYDIALAVDPANANTVYLIGDITWDTSATTPNWSLSIFKGTITGGAGSYAFPFNPANTGDPSADPTWVGRGVHSDGHGIAFALNTAGTAHDGTQVWVVSDGGVFRSTSSGGAGTFVARNTGLAITEMTYLAQRVDTDAALLAGCQDNGTVRFWGEQAWYESPQGDGGGIAVDPNNQYRVMRQYVKAGKFTPSGVFSPGLSTSTDGGASGSWSGLTFPPFTANTAAQRSAVNTENSATSFYSPIAASPAGVSPTLAAFGTNRLWLTPDWGGSWVTLPTATNPYAPAMPNATQDVLDGASVIATEFASGTRIFAATQNAVWRFDQSGGVWSRTALPTAGLPGSRIITDIAVADAAAGSIYITLGGNSASHIYFFAGGSATSWQDAALSVGGSINVPAHAVVVDPADPLTLYVGTDVGCFKGTKTGATTWNWSLFSQGLPEAAITDLLIHARTRLLRAATHGRGVWEVTIDAPSESDPDIYLRVNYADTGRLPGGARYPWVENAEDPTSPGFHVFHWMSPDIKVRRPSLTGLPLLGTPPDYLDFATNIGDYIDSTSHIETADTTTNSIFVQVHNRSLVPVQGNDVRVLLLLTDAAAGLPPLPAGYAAHIVAGDDPATWLPGSLWHAATPTSPYRTLPGTLDVRTPQVVEFDVDLSSLALPAGHDHVCAAAFVTTISAADRLTATNTNLDLLTMSDKHVVHRNLHLVAAGSQPIADGEFEHEPQTIIIDFHNKNREEEELVDVVFHREQFPGHISVLLPKLPTFDHTNGHLEGWKIEHHSRLGVTLSGHFSRFFDRFGEVVEEVGEEIEELAGALLGEHLPPDDREIKIRGIGNLDRSRVFVADDSNMLTIRRLPVSPERPLTAAVTLRAPDSARPGDRFRFHVIQYDSKGAIVGGSSYVFAVTASRQET